MVCGHGVQRTKCMGRRNPVGRCAWAELEWCNYSRTLPILPSFPYLRAIFVQSRIPFMSPTQTDWWTFKSNSQQFPWQCVVLCMFIAILMPFLNSSESVAPLWCGHILACIILPWPDDRLKLSGAFGNAGRWAAGLDAGV